MKYLVSAALLIALSTIPFCTPDDSATIEPGPGIHTPTNTP